MEHWSQLEVPKDLTNIDMGAVFVYKKALDDTGVYNYNPTLTSPRKKFQKTLVIHWLLVAVYLQ